MAQVDGISLLAPVLSFYRLRLANEVVLLMLLC